MHHCCAFPFALAGLFLFNARYYTEIASLRRIVTQAEHIKIQTVYEWKKRKSKQQEESC